MPQVISLRLPDATAERLRTAARRAGRTLNEWGALSLEEWLRQNEFADIEFRSAGGERQACLKGALPVWQVVQVARSYGLDPERTAGHFGWPARRIRAALNYYEAFPAEIDQPIEDGHAMTETALKRLLPQMEVLAVPASHAVSDPTGNSNEAGNSEGREEGAETASLS
jgi:uncharacterized protein (DUF433 family)